MMLTEALALCAELSDTEGDSHYGQAIRRVMSEVHAFMAPPAPAPQFTYSCDGDRWVYRKEKIDGVVRLWRAPMLSAKHLGDGTYSSNQWEIAE